jgi:hypothetical protein
VVPVEEQKSRVCQEIIRQQQAQRKPSQTDNERSCSMLALGNAKTKLKLILVFSNPVKFNKVEIFTSAGERKRRN